MVAYFQIVLIACSAGFGGLVTYVVGRRESVVKIRKMSVETLQIWQEMANKMSTQVANLTNEVVSLRKEKNDLKKEIVALQWENRSLRTEVQKLQQLIK